MIFCGVASSGKTVVFAFAFLENEEEGYDYAVEHFTKSLVSGSEESGAQPPKVIILERNSGLRQAF